MIGRLIGRLAPLLCIGLIACGSEAGAGASASPQDPSAPSGNSPPSDACDGQRACAGKCGVVKDNCGADVDCGGCQAGEVCDAGGACGAGTCTPTCSAKMCGDSDGCGGKCATGPCAGGHRCIAGTCVAEKVLLIGGIPQSPRPTWQWDGATWSVVGTPAAPPGYALAGAGVGNAFVVEGGRVGDSLVADTWIWRDSAPAWTKLTVPAPPGRAFHAAATLNGKLVVFGGASALGAGSNRDDTWTWDGVQWTEAKPATRPPARSSHSMAVAGGKVILFGGIGSGGVMNDTWTWDGTTWTKVETATSPPARAFAAMASLNGKAVLFGGLAVASASAARLADTWLFDGATWTKAVVAQAPPARSNHAMAAINGKVVLFGGQTPSTVGDTWVFDGTGWTAPVLTTTPAPSQYHVMATLP